MEAIRPNPTLSDDLIREILVRIPVKSLLCFQLVCKAWLSLIKHPAFAKSQLRHAITTQTDQTLIISYYKRYDEKAFSLLHASSCQIVVDLKFPHSRDDFKTKIVVGSANGIFCVHVTSPNLEDSIYFWNPASIYLWNPATGQSKLIPSCNNEFPSKKGLGFSYHGFGYDPIDHDYKVVRVVSWLSSSARRFLSAEVYSANQNVWRKAPVPFDVPFSPYFDVCVNGYMCGIGRCGMVSFDFNKEVFNCAIKLPVIFNDVHIIAHVIEFNKSIAVILSNSLNGDKKINIWSLDDDACLRGGGVEASWTPMFSIDTYTDLAEARIIYGLFSNRDFLLQIINGNDDYVWISCDVDKKEAKFLPLSIDKAKNIYTRTIYKYTESLVSLPGFKQIKGEDDN